MERSLRSALARRLCAGSFRVGGAAGTIAKSISAYDMAVSDAVYGKADRYVSAGRLQGMLDKEFQLNVDRLGDERGDGTSFFAFRRHRRCAQLQRRQRMPRPGWV